MYPHELRECIPEIEECMKAGMRMATPDVRVDVETSCMRHWDKGAIEFNDLEFDDAGNPVNLEEPEFVRGLKKQKESEK